MHCTKTNNIKHPCPNLQPASPIPSSEALEQNGNKAGRKYFGKCGKEKTTTCKYVDRELTWFVINITNVQLWE